MADGPNRVPGRCDVPPSNGAPRMTTSASAHCAGESRSQGGTPRKVMSGPYIAPYRVMVSHASGSGGAGGMARSQRYGRVPPFPFTGRCDRRHYQCRGRFRPGGVRWAAHNRLLPTRCHFRWPGGTGRHYFATFISSSRRSRRRWRAGLAGAGEHPAARAARRVRRAHRGDRGRGRALRRTARALAAARTPGADADSASTRRSRWRCRRCNSRADLPGTRVDEIRRCGGELLRALSRHRQRGADLVYDAYETDIGGET